MEFVPGDLDLRPSRVTACAGRTGLLREAERDLELHSLVGVQVDGRRWLTYDQVHREALRQLRIPGYALRVTMLKPATFLLRFEQPAQRNAALGRGPISAGGTRLHLMPWTRQFGVAAASKLNFRVRVCIEGIPGHAAADLVAIGKLFSSTTIVDRVDQELRKEEEAACVCVWVTTLDPDTIAIAGTLRLEEPVQFSEEEYHDFCTRMGNMELPEVRPGAASLLDFDVLLHIDEVIDFSPLTSSPSWKSSDSATSGLPDESLEAEWPVKHFFSWRLGVPDRARSPRRVTVHDRLGSVRRDRSPGRGAGGSQGQMQVPPPPHSAFRGAGVSGHAGRPGGHGGGAGSSGAGGHVCGRVMEPKVGDGVPAGVGEDMPDVAVVDQSMQKEAVVQFQEADKHAVAQADLAFLIGERCDNHATAWDPMLWEVSGQHAWAHKKGGVEGRKKKQEVLHDLSAVLDAHCISHSWGSACIESSVPLPDLMQEEALCWASMGVPVSACHATASLEGVLVSQGGCEDPESVDVSLPDDGPNRDTVHSSVPGPQPMFQAELVTDAKTLLPDVVQLCDIAGDLGIKTSEALISSLDVGNGMARFVVPIMEPVLLTPVCKSNFASAMEKSAEAEWDHAKATSAVLPQRRSKRLASKPPTNLTLEEQATALLIKKSGIVCAFKKPSEQDKHRFHSKFVDNLEGEMVTGMRDMFGLPEGGAMDILAPLIIDAEA
ncbi:hypothetical protein PVAP13_2NG370400 [Panicum virgatum]|uniref:DUF4283 domain-containing protein n=1 Tax=Panicum virgatum TaxID=38727 RepID=A0A8T0VI78_PANVG|nr:hypothetical protein PVAP13_2NG370400 [Panicum virgatum]